VDGGIGRQFAQHLETLFSTAHTGEPVVYKRGARGDFQGHVVPYRDFAIL